MNYGMSYAEYWDGDNEAPKFYRRAYELKRKEANFDLYLQGAYVYEAILSCAPVLKPLAKASQPMPYRDSPFPLTAKEMREAEERKEREQFEQMRDAMKSMANRINAKRQAQRRDLSAGA